MGEAKAEPNSGQGMVEWCMVGLGGGGCQGPWLETSAHSHPIPNVSQTFPGLFSSSHPIPLSWELLGHAMEVAGKGLDLLQLDDGLQPDSIKLSPGQRSDLPSAKAGA